MITQQVYDAYLKLLLRGERFGCQRVVEDLLKRDVEIKALYTDLFQQSLYAVGELWEANKISVAKEHLATAITEGLLPLVYPRLFETRRAPLSKKIVLSCAPNEFHQIGGKMVADLFELHGWDGHFLGANTPVDHMLAYIEDTRPDLVGLSLSVFFNVPSLRTCLDAIRSNFKDLAVIVGGQAFRWGGVEAIKHCSSTEYIPNLLELEKMIKPL